MDPISLPAATRVKSQQVPPTTTTTTTTTAPVDPQQSQIEAILKSIKTLGLQQVLALFEEHQSGIDICEKVNRCERRNKEPIHLGWMDEKVSDDVLELVKVIGRTREEKAWGQVNKPQIKAMLKSVNTLGLHRVLELLDKHRAGVDITSQVNQYRLTSDYDIDLSWMNEATEDVIALVKVVGNTLLMKKADIVEFINSCGGAMHTDHDNRVQFPKVRGTLDLLRFEHASQTLVLDPAIGLCFMSTQSDGKVCAIKLMSLPKLLRYLDISILDLKRKHLVGLNLSKGNWAYKDLTSFSLASGFFNRSTMHSVKMTGAYASRIQLCEVDMQGADCKDVYFSQSNLMDSRCRWVSFDDADLSLSDLRGVDYWQASMNRVNLAGAKIDDTTQFAPASFSLKEWDGKDTNYIKNSVLTLDGISDQYSQHKLAGMHQIIDMLLKEEVSKDKFNTLREVLLDVLLSVWLGNPIYFHDQKIMSFITNKLLPTEQSWGVFSKPRISDKAGPFCLWTLHSWKHHLSSDDTKSIPFFDEIASLIREPLEKATDQLQILDVVLEKMSLLGGHCATLQAKLMSFLISRGVIGSRQSINTRDGVNMIALQLIWPNKNCASEKNIVLFMKNKILSWHSSEKKKTYSLSKDIPLAELVHRSKLCFIFDYSSLKVKQRAPNDHPKFICEQNELLTRRKGMLDELELDTTTEERKNELCKSINNIVDELKTKLFNLLNIENSDSDLYSWLVAEFPNDQVLKMHGQFEMEDV